MTELLVLAGIVSQEILGKVKKNQGVSIFLYDSNFIYSTLHAAYENAKEKFSFSHIRRLLENMSEWNETVVKQAFLKSVDFTDFLGLIPREMYLSLMFERYLKPVMNTFGEKEDKGKISGENTEDFARILRLNPKVHGTVAFPFPVGNKIVHVDSGRTAKNFPTITGVSHVILGFPILSEADLEKISEKLLADTPRCGKTEEEREAYARVHQPVVITAEQVIAAGGCKKLYL